MPTSKLCLAPGRPTVHQVFKYSLVQVYEFRMGINDHVYESEAPVSCWESVALWAECSMTQLECWVQRPDQQPNGWISKYVGKQGTMWTNKQTVLEASYKACLPMRGSLWRNSPVNGIPSVIDHHNQLINMGRTTTCRAQNQALVARFWGFAWTTAISVEPPNQAAVLLVIDPLSMVDETGRWIKLQGWLCR